MEDHTQGNIFVSILHNTQPSAYAWVEGNSDHPELGGMVYFYETPIGGVVVNAEIDGLPNTNPTNFYAFHIHEFGDCTPPFDKTGSHYNPQNEMHPKHAGDMPPLLANGDYAWTAFFDNRITVEKIIGKSVVIHDMRDDFTTQPSGDSGKKIACGVIEKYVAP